LLVVLFVHGPKDTFLATLLLSAGFLIAGILGVAVALRYHVRHVLRPGRGDIHALLRDGRHLFLTSAAVSLYSNTNTFLVGVLGGNVAAGYFSLADKLIRAATGLIAPVVQGSYPHVVRLMAQSRDLALGFIRKTILRISGVACLVGGCVLLLAKPLALVAFRHDALQVVPLVRWLAVFPLLAAVNYVLGVLVLIPFGFDEAQSQLLLGVGVINVVVGCLLIPRYGALGGVLAMNVIESLQILGSTMILTRGGVKIFAKRQAQIAR
jgi:O-antigen/teichoic acid export membrane protein